MQLAKSGNKAVYHASYVSKEGSWENIGLCLWVKGKISENAKDIASLMPTESGDELLIDFGQAVRQGLEIRAEGLNAETAALLLQQNGLDAAAVADAMKKRRSHNGKIYIRVGKRRYNDCR